MTHFSYEMNYYSLELSTTTELSLEIKIRIAISYYKYDYYVQNYHICHNTAAFLLNHQLIRPDHLPLLEVEVE